MKKVLLTLLAIGMLVVGATAQNKILVKRIYLVDVTKSMIGEGRINGKFGTDAIFDKLKNDLASTLDSICDDDEIVIIPFTNKTFEKITGCGSNKHELADKVRMMTTKPGDTNIDEAWLAGIRELDTIKRNDTTKINLLFLMTDGIHNCGPNINELYKHLETWDDSKNNLAFYFMLTKNAESNKIDSIAQTKTTMETIHSSDIKINILQLYTSYKVNIEGKNSLNARLPLLGGSSCPVELKHVKMSLGNNTDYSISEYRIFTNEVTLTLSANKAKNMLPISQPNFVSFSWDDNISGNNSKTYVIPKVINLQIDNLGTRTMKIY